MTCKFRSSKLVKDIKEYFTYRNHKSIPSCGKPNSVIKKIVNGYVVSERYYCCF